MDDKYQPRSFEELAGDPTPVTLIMNLCLLTMSAYWCRGGKDRCTPSWRRTWLMLKA
jgi:hypothetical protein